jgi:hypothetical protein
MARAHGQAKKELEQVGADPNVDDTEGTPREDTWVGRGAHSHGWFEALLRKWGKKSS